LKKVYIASDHAGFTLKEQIKKKFANKINIIDLGTDNSTTSVNYPNYAHQLCKKVSLDNKNIGILVCGSGMGMSMAAINVFLKTPFESGRHLKRVKKI